MAENNYHEPVLKAEVLDFLNLKAPLKERVLDATLGNAGHAIEIVKKGANLVGLEIDKKALEVAKKRIEEACPPHLKDKVGSFRLFNANFKDMGSLANRENLGEFDAILFDLGVNTDQLMGEAKGLSFSHGKSPLDMRLGEEGVKAADLLNALRLDQLTSLFSETMEEWEAKKLAQKIVEKRKEKAFATVSDLLAVTGKTKKGKTHPGTRAFLALRIAVNSELENLKEALPAAFSLLKKGGRLLVISFHSAEDRIVKSFMKGKEAAGEGKLITKKPVVPGETEIEKNKKARSAKMRVIEKK